MDDFLVFLSVQRGASSVKVFLMLFARLASDPFPALCHAPRYELQSHGVTTNCLIFLKTPCLSKGHVLFIFESSVLCLPCTE